MSAPTRARAMRLPVLLAGLLLAPAAAASPGDTVVVNRLGAVIEIESSLGSISELLAVHARLTREQPAARIIVSVRVQA